MKAGRTLVVLTFFAMPALAASVALKQEQSFDAREENFRAYVTLLRSDIKAERKDIINTIMQFNQAGRMAGKSELQLELTEIVLNGSAYPALSSDYKVSGKSSGGRSAKRILGGTGLGSAIGAIAGNAGMGATIGAVLELQQLWCKRARR